MPDLRWGRAVTYAGVVMLIYALSTVMEALRALLVPALVAVPFLILGDVIEATKGKDRAFLTRLSGAVLAALMLSPGWNLPVALILLGAGVSHTATRRENYRMVARGTGLLLCFYGISQLPYISTFGSVFSLTGLFLFLGYLGLELGKGAAWTSPIERNLLGLGITGAIIGLYITVRDSLGSKYPSLVFYGEWLALLLAALTAGLIVYSYVSENDPEAYLVSQWRKHKAGTLEKLAPEFAEAHSAIEDFVVHGRKGKLIAFIAYYSSRLPTSREQFEAIIRKIADYENRKPSILTPLWIKRLQEKRELERRIKLVNEVFEELRELMGWKEDEN